MNSPNFRDLTPSAARLLLARVVAQSQPRTPELEDILEVAGIRQFSTYQKAQDQLTKEGFLFKKDGRTIVSLVPTKQ